jgi:hypothetical protein
MGLSDAGSVEAAAAMILPQRIAAGWPGINPVTIPGGWHDRNHVRENRTAGMAAGDVERN